MHEGTCYFANDDVSHGFALSKIAVYLDEGTGKIDMDQVRRDSCRINIEPKGPHKVFVLEEKDNGFHEQVAERLIKLGVVDKQHIRTSNLLSDFGPYK